MAKGSDRTLRVVFRGVRGSYPVPDAAFLGYGGNTTCHEVRAGGRLIIIDAGTGVIPLGNELLAEHLRTKEPVVGTLLFSHVHHDHTYGFLFFKPLYLRSTRLAILGHRTFAGSVRQELRDITVSPFHPVGLDEMGFQRQFHDLVGGEILRLRGDQEAPEILRDTASVSPADVIVRTVANPNHTKLGVLHFRVEYAGKSYVFATDIEGTEEGEETLAEFATGADLLAHDGQYRDDEYYRGTPPRQGWGHSTIRMACTTAQKAAVKQLAIIHHDPEHTDEQLDAMEAEAKQLFPAAFLARENQVVDL